MRTSLSVASSSSFLCIFFQVMLTISRFALLFLLNLPLLGLGRDQEISQTFLLGLLDHLLLLSHVHGCKNNIHLFLDSFFTNFLFLAMTLNINILPESEASAQRK